VAAGKSERASKGADRAKVVITHLIFHPVEQPDSKSGNGACLISKLRQIGYNPVAPQNSEEGRGV
jgi:hypothetical protein